MDITCRNQLGFKLKTISKRMAQNLNAAITSLELTSSQAFVLGYLCHHRDEKIYPRDLEQEFGFTHPTVSGLLQRLESKGFLECKPSPDDRRLKRITVTDKALQLNRQFLNEMRAAEAALVEDFSQREIAQLHNFLDRMIQNITPSSDEGGTHS